MPESIAMLTNKTYLMMENGGKWSMFLPITKYPQNGGEPDRHEVTRMHDTMKRYILGLQDSSLLSFDSNYTKEDYAKASAAADGSVHKFRLCFGDELGTDGCWEWEGKVTVYINEGEVNSVRKMTVVISDEGEKAISEVPALSEELLEG